MEIQEINRVKLEGVGACVPAHSVESERLLAPIYADKAADIVKATGIETLRRADDGVTAVDLCVHAAARLLKSLVRGTTEKEFLSSFAAVVFVSFTEKVKMPAAACRAQSLLSLPSDVMTIDLSLACSGWCSGLCLAAHIASLTRKRVLLLDGDVQTSRLAPGDKATTPVLADAGSAAVVAPGRDTDTMRFSFFSDGAQGDALKLEEGGAISMDGFAVYRFVAMKAAAFIGEFISSLPGGKDSFDAFVPHQANVYMIKQLANSLGFDPSRLWVSADRFGNPASASIPLTIASSAEGAPRGSDLEILAAGFGGGLSAATAAFTLPADAVTEISDYGC